MRPVYIVLLVVLALVVVVLLVLNNPSSDVSKTPTDNNTLDPVNGTTDPIDIPNNDLEPVVPIDPNIYCENNFSCFIENFVECKQDVFYTLEDSISYPDNGTVYDFSIDYEIKGFNELSYCMLDVTLNDHAYAFTDFKKQSFINDNGFTENDVLALEDLLNSYTTHLVSTSGTCYLDASSYNLEDTSMSFLRKNMRDLDECQGPLFEIPDVEDFDKKRFFIYIN